MKTATSKYFYFVAFLLVCWPIKVECQYSISINIAEPNIEQDYIAHLRIVEEWDGFFDFDPTKVLQTAPINESGSIHFSGNELPNEKAYYQVRFAPKDNPSFIIGGGKNYVNFILSNNDSIRLLLKSQVFASILNLESSIEENQRHKKVSNGLDSLKAISLEEVLHPKRLKRISAETDSLEVYRSIKQSDSDFQFVLLGRKKKDYLLRQIKDGSPLVNMFALFHADVDFTQEADIAHLIREGLNNKKLVSSYGESLDDTMRTNEPRLGGQENILLYTTIMLLALMIMILLGYIFYSKRKHYAPENDQKEDLLSLTNKELQIYHLILDHKSNKEIATKLFISPSTVKTHINNIYRKLNISSREQLILMNGDIHLGLDQKSTH